MMINRRIFRAAHSTLMPLCPDRAKLLRYTACVYPIVLAAMGAIALLTGVLDRAPYGMIILALLGLGAMALGGLFALPGRQNSTTRTSTPNYDPAQEQARHIQMAMRFVVVATVFSGGYVTFQIMQMEYGGAQHVRLWRPLTDLYHSFGFWPAVMCVPVSGVLILLAFARKLRSIRQ